MRFALLLLMVLVVSTPTTVWAEKIACPDMGIPLSSSSPHTPSGKIVTDHIKDMSSAYVYCEYGPKNIIHLSWFTSLNDQMWENKCRNNASRLSTDDIHVDYNKKKKWIYLVSKSRLTQVYVRLSSKEFRKRKEAWVRAGRELLQRELNRGMSCSHESSPTVEKTTRPAIPVKPISDIPPPAKPAVEVDAEISDIINRLKSSQ